MVPNMLDYLILGFVVFCYFLSSLRGGAKQIFSFLAVIGAFMVAAASYADIAKVFPEKVFPASFAGTAGFGTSFLLAFGMISLVGKFLDGAFKRMHFGGIDRVVSIVVGILKGFTLGCMMVTVLMVTYPADNPLLVESVSARYLMKPVRMVAKLLGSKDLKEFYKVQTEVTKTWEGQVKTK
jgi:uncharacterized membrane protein required for colicin V production